MLQRVAFKVDDNMMLQFEIILLKLF